ncbi:MAG: aldolase/citrate lyase family protein [Gemmatimonadota bacterium]|nr:aldolase/citrate lyase family protein [Gemmatimonadota bacterium]
MKNLSAGLESGRMLLGCVVTYPAPGMIERLRDDWDWFWIDGQHGELGYQDMLALVRACDLAGCGSLVRVPSHEPGWIGQVMDMAPSGVIVPQVEDAVQAGQLVQAAKFPPLGNRSCGGRRPIDLLGREYADTANRETILLVQLESPGAVARAEEIAAVEGVDCLLIGPNDVKLRLGYSMTEPRPAAEELAEIEALVKLCREYGKLSAVFGVEGEQLASCARLGVNLAVSGVDARFLAEGSKRLSDESRDIINRHSGENH